ncbi:DUF4142 domain-containing protein [Halomonas sp. MCCC 1A11036]|uniref:DUF4142 domain-containing protein n=1 Tax=Billgrantia zhangzhouensis TaxID=2733481 RepID=A0ABS9ALH9_9GAMM|nr:DUF4142 domain-containing protein [Halomonas zhangzhouensis]MCE8022507.1 DUF4142 domain-containing protein [Halomonas zhangzhouensis]
MRGLFSIHGILATISIAGGLFTSLAWAELDRDEVQAVLYALHTHQAELAELARERAGRDEVAQLASTLERDHGILEEWLVEADDGRDAPPSEPTGAVHDRDTFNTLAELDGEAFDAAFLDYQMELHTAAIEYLERNRPQGDEQLDEFNNHLFVTHETLLVNGELVDSLR